MEPSWLPLTKSVDYFSQHLGNPIDIDREVVGLCAIRDEEGYTRRIVYSTGESFVIDSSQDVITWFAVKDLRIFFVDDSIFLDTLLKYFGEQAIIAYRKGREEGSRCILGTGFLSFKALSGDSFTVYDGVRVNRKVCAINNFYHGSPLISVENDAISVGLLGQRLLNTLKANDLDTTSLNSPGGILQAQLIGRFKRSELPEEVMSVAKDSYHTNWISAFKWGTYPKAWDYDINSAFAFEMSNLISCSPTYGRWVRSRRYIKSSFYGMCVAEIFIHEDVSPVILRKNNWFLQMNSHTGSWTGFITKSEVDFIRESGMGKVRLLDGMWFVADRVRFPFRAALTRFFVLRDIAREQGDSFLGNLCKLVNVTGQGKTISLYRNEGDLVAGPLFNPVYGAEIVARTRVRLAKMCVENSASLLHVAVDGATFNKYIPFSTTEPGGIRLQSPIEGEPCLVAGDARYHVPSRASKFNPRHLEMFASSETMLEPSVVNRYSARSLCPFDDIGKELTETPRVHIKSAVRGSYRVVLGTPTKWGDLLDNQYDTAPRMIV